VTAGLGRNERLQFRWVRLGEDSGPIDPSKPLLLRAEHLDTRESGFWEQTLSSTGAPQKLIMSAKAYTNPLKAKNADVVVLTATRFDEFGDLLITDSKFRNVRKVSNANPQKDQFIWGTAELVRFTNLDGVPLQAALYKPANFDPNKKYPLVVYIYERLSQTVHGWKAPAPGHSLNIPLYVSNGYLVLTPDIAYTIGYPGQSAMKCVLPAIQAVADKGYVNESAIGIQGHSWGGYQIAYMVTQTNRFKAAAAGAPVANMTSAYDGIRWGTGLPRQFQYERTQSRIGGSLWQYPSRFLENSPLFHADRVKTPLLLLHNDGDDAVPWYQGIELFLALRRLGKESYLFNYNGEPHGLRKRPNQRDYAMRMQQFFDHHLKGAAKPAWMDRGIPYLDRESEKEQWKKTNEPLPTGGGAQ
jgi:dipeptidyl aminopeptidase/acylaminoacyl peptidase